MTAPASDEVLRRAARALRDEAERDRSGGVEAWEGMDGWHDVSRDIRQAARRRRLRLVVGLQLVAALMGVGAWAAASGRLPPILSRWVPAMSRSAAPGPSAQARKPRARVVASQAAATPPAPAEAPPAPEAPPAEAGPVAVPLPAAPRAPAVTRRLPPPESALVPAPAPAAASGPGAAAAAGPDPEEIYRAAHREHFVRRDYETALALWDRYLASGGGSLALEARYNRAIALVRLDRRAAAIAALAPFAAGQHDGYRQEEAEALLRMLGPAAAPPPPP